MNKNKLKAFCKINLNLRVLKKLRNGYHKIQSIVTFCDLHDIIYVSETKNTKDKIIFSGKFKNSINTKSNTITKVLKLFRKRNLLSKKKFEIEIKKNIPHSSGLGGGSSDAAIFIKFLNFKRNLKLNNNEMNELGKTVGSDVPLSLVQKYLVVSGNTIKTLKLKKSFTFYILIIFPNLPCSTKEIYNKNRDFSLPMLVSKNILKDKKKLIKFLQNEHNDLQKTVSKIYPKISKIIEVISIQKGCHFSRLTGSGSACFGLFSSMSKATLAEKNIKKKFPKYWSVVSKSI